MSRISQRSLLVLSLPALAAVAVWFGAASQPVLPALTAGANAAAAATPAAELAVAVMATGERADAIARRGYWSAPAGARFRYAIDDRLVVRMAQPQAPVQAPAILDIRSTATATVLARRDGEALVEFAFADLRLLGGDGREGADDEIAQSYRAAAATATLARIDGLGRVQGFGFAGELDGDQRNFLRGVIQLLTFEAPVDGATAWTSEGCDNTGRHEARYEALAGDDADTALVRRTRQRLLSVRGMDELPKHSITGGATARFALARGWLAGVELAETVALDTPLMDLQITTERTAASRLVGEDAVAVDAAADSAWGRVDASASGDGERTGGYAAASQRREWEARLRGVTLADLLAEIDRLLASAQSDQEAVNEAFQKLQWLLRGDDAATRALADQLLAGQIAAQSSGLAIGALGAAGTAAAQDALVALRDDGTRPELREHATVACLQLAEPNTKVMQSLTDAARSGDATRGPSLLVMGALAGRANERLADGNTPLATLLALEMECTARGELDAWVYAVGNAGAPQALAIALRLLGHELPAVRVACCVVLRNRPEADAYNALVQRGLADAEPLVRMEALSALSRRSEPGVRGVIQATATLDLDAGVRERAARLLASE